MFEAYSWHGWMSTERCSRAGLSSEAGKGQSEKENDQHHRHCYQCLAREAQTYQTLQLSRVQDAMTAWTADWLDSEKKSLWMLTSIGRTLLHDK